MGDRRTPTPGFPAIPARSAVVLGACCLACGGLLGDIAAQALVGCGAMWLALGCIGLLRGALQSRARRPVARESDESAPTDPA